MLETAIIAVRLVQYAGAAVLFGSPLLCLYAAPRLWPRHLFATAAGFLVLSSLLAIGLQSSLLAGSLRSGFSTSALADTIAFLPLAKAALVRAVAAVVALGILVPAGPTHLSRCIVTACGALSAASLAWMGHAGGSDNQLQLIADIIHAVAASAWLGALGAFLSLLGDPKNGPRRQDLLAAMRRFSLIGVPIVAVLVASGIANTCFLVGLGDLSALPRTRYGLLLLIKVVAFGAMLALAGLNQRWLTPALARSATQSVRNVILASICAEMAFGLIVLALVSWLGTLEPPMS